MKKLFLVTGMHRSGTSCVANLLHRLGLDFGKDPGLSEAKLDNKYGNWEDRDFVSTNDSLLLYKHSFWFDPFNFRSPESLAEVPEYIQKKTAAIDRRVAGAERNTGIKDPRSSLTLPFWRKALSERELNLVYVFRKPESVAASLASRNSIPFEYGLALWEYYVRAAAVGAKDMKCTYVAFDRLISNPQITCRKLADEMELKVAPKNIRNAIDAVIDPKACTPDSSTPALPDEVDDLFDALESRGLAFIASEISEFALQSWQQLAPNVHSRFMHKEVLFLRDRFLDAPPS